MLEVPCSPHSRLPRSKALLTIIQRDNVVSTIHSFVKDREGAILLDQVRECKAWTTHHPWLWLQDKRSCVDDRKAKPQKRTTPIFVNARKCVCPKHFCDDNNRLSEPPLFV